MYIIIQPIQFILTSGSPLASRGFILKVVSESQTIIFILGIIKICTGQILNIPANCGAIGLAVYEILSPTFNLLHFGIG